MKLSWPEAGQYCKDFNMELVSFETKQELEKFAEIGRKRKGEVT